MPLIKSRLRSKNTKLRLSKVFIRPIVLYACGAWASTRFDEKRLLVLKRKIIRRIYGLKMKRGGEYLMNEEQIQMYVIYSTNQTQWESLKAD